MKKLKDLAYLVVGLAMGLYSCRNIDNKVPNNGNIDNKVPNGLEFKVRILVSGVITNVDEDSFFIKEQWGKIINFQFENIELTEYDEKTHRLIYPGPSNYKVGDKLNLFYDILFGSRIEYKDLAKKYYGNYMDVQGGFVQGDGIIDPNSITRLIDYP